MVQAVSKNKLASWYRSTAIQHIRPVDLDELTSQYYWEKWDRVCDTDLRKITRAFFERLWQAEAPSADCLLFDTTNYYTYMASHYTCPGFASKIVSAQLLDMLFSKVLPAMEPIFWNVTQIECFPGLSSLILGMEIWPHFARTAGLPSILSIQHDVLVPIDSVIVATMATSESGLNSPW
jgi:hypothetical protein